MSRIGKQPVEMPAGVTANLNGMELTVKGPKGELSMTFVREVKPALDGNVVTIVAADDERKKVIQESNKEQFKDLDIRFFSYSAVEELYNLCERRKLKGVNDEFLDCFMEAHLLEVLFQIQCI